MRILCLNEGGIIMSVFQDTLVCLSETDPVRCQSLYISTRHQGQDVTYTLTAHTPEDTQRWTVALWQHVYNMSEAWMYI